MASLAELRETKFLKTFEEVFPDAGPPSASTSPGDPLTQSVERGTSTAPDALPQGGTGGYAVIVGSTYDAVPIRKWASTLKEGTLILVGSPRFSKNGVPMNGEAVLMDAGNATEIEWGEDYLGKNFRNLQPGLLLATARADDLTVVLFGSGKKIDQVKNELAKWYPELPTSVVDC